MSEKRHPNLDFLADWSEDALVAAFGQGLSSDDRILLFVLDGVCNTGKPELKAAIHELCKELWLTRNPVGAVCKALLIGSELDKSQLISLGAKKAANKRHEKVQELYERACAFVTLDLDGNCNPEWQHTDYANKILSDPKFSGLKKEGLVERIKAVFKERGLTDRLGRPAHIKK